VNVFFRRLVVALRFIAASIVVVCFAYMTVAVLAQVFGRYLFNYSISWTEETAKVWTESPDSPTLEGFQLRPPFVVR